MKGVDFEREVWPILADSCVKCHGAPKKDRRGRMRSAKAGLRLDGKGHILAGSETSKTVVVPGKAKESLLIQLVSLPADDDEIMPPKGDPLTKQQIATLARWIDEGAEFGSWKGAGGGARAAEGASAPADPRAAIHKILKEVAQGVEPVEAAALQNVCAGLATVEPVLPGSPLLRVSFSSHERKITDELLQGLKPLSDHIAQLDLGRASISEKSLPLLFTMKRLVRLDLQWTRVSGDFAGADWLHLRSLNLNGTKVTDAAIPVLQGLGKLEHLYVWETAITDSSVAALRAARPKLRVRHKLRLPEPAPAEGGRRSQ